MFHQKLQRSIEYLLFHVAAAQNKLGQKSPQRTRCAGFTPPAFTCIFPRCPLHCCRSSRRDRRLLLKRLNLSRQESFSTISNARSTSWIARKLLSADSNVTLETTREGNDRTEDGITRLWRPVCELPFRLLLPSDNGEGQPARWLDIIVSQILMIMSRFPFHSPDDVNDESVWYRAACQAWNASSPSNVDDGK